MAFIPVTNTVQTNIRYTQIGQLLMNGLYWHKATPWTLTEVQALADDLWDAWATNMMIDLSTSLTLTEVQAIDLTTATSSIASHVQTLSGSDGGAPMTPNDAFVLKLNTASRGRSFRGRIYLPGLTNNHQATLAVLSTTAANNLLGNLQGIQTAIEASSGADLVVVSRYSGVDVNGDPIPRASGVATPVTSISYSDLNMDSQRRRLPGRGV